ncbi:MAG: DUF3379 family protein [Rudaea sp.]|nr:DUF3379 family protein [Rudaea sp.]
MNCLEFRRRLGVDPQCCDVDFVQHRQECARCAGACERAHGFETSLRQALVITPPAQLAESILLAHATRQQQQRQGYRRGAVLALAAAVALAFGIGTRVAARPLATIAVDHLNSEAEVLGMTKTVADSEVQEAFAYRGVALGKIPAGISFVACCPVGGYESVHMVMPQAEGPVTVLYLTNDRHEQRKDFARDGWIGRSVPLASGTLVLLAHDSSHFDQMENLWRSALQSPTPAVAAGT